MHQSFSPLRRLTLSAVLLCAAAVGPQAGAQDDAGFTSQGRGELGFQASYLIINPDEGDSVDILSGNLDFSYFFVDNWALRPQYQVVRFSNGTSTTGHFLGLGLDFHIPHDNIAFYFGGAPNVGFVSNGDSDTEFFAEFRGGIKHYLSETLALNTQLSYSFGSDYALTRASVGLSVLFGGN